MVLKRIQAVAAVLPARRSSINKLPFMILSPPEHTAEIWVLLQKQKATSYRKMHFSAEKKCLLLQKNAVFGGHVARNCRKLQEGFRAQESRTLGNFHKRRSAGPTWSNNGQDKQLGQNNLAIHTETITNENLGIFFRFRFRNGKANAFPKIVIRFCFRNEHVVGLA